GEPGFRLGLWALAVGAVAVTTVMTTDGNPSYTTRYAYALPLTTACTAAVIVDLVVRGPLAPRLASSKVASIGLTVILGLLVARVGESYAQRLEVALKYYNPLTSLELGGVRWLSGRPGTVAVSPKGGDEVAGTLYAWTIEGMARVRAIGTD